MSYIQHTAHCCLVSTLFTDLPEVLVVEVPTSTYCMTARCITGIIQHYIKRIVRAGGDCLVVVHSEVVSTLAAQTRVPGFNSRRLLAFHFLLVTAKLISSLFPAELKCSD